MASTFMDHPWRPTAAIFFVNGAVFGVWATQIPLAKERLALDPAMLGVMLLILGCGAVASMVTSGYLIRRFGTAPIIRWSAVLFCVMLPIVATAPNVAVLAVSLALFGAGGGCMDVSMNAHASAVEKAAGRAYMSSFHGMWSLGGLSGRRVGGRIAERRLGSGPGHRRGAPPRHRVRARLEPHGRARPRGGGRIQAGLAEA